MLKVFLIIFFVSFFGLMFMDFLMRFFLWDIIVLSLFRFVFLLIVIMIMFMFFLYSFLVVCSFFMLFVLLVDLLLINMISICFILGFLGFLLKVFLIFCKVIFSLGLLGGSWIWLMMDMRFLLFRFWFWKLIKGWVWVLNMMVK